MTLPTGTISLSQVNTELGRPATQAISLNDAGVRGLSGMASGASDMNNLRGKSARSISMSGTMQPQQVGQFLADTATLGIVVSDGATPSSYAWSIVVDYGGMASLTPLTEATATLRGPTYPTSVSGMYYDVVVQCVCVVGGTSFTVESTFSYNVDDGSGDV